MSKEQTSDKKATWDKFQTTIFGRLILYLKAKALEKILREIDFKTAIDVGCGQGYTLKPFVKKGVSVIGIDTSKRAINVCRRKGYKVYLRNLRQEKTKFELVFSDGLIEHCLNFEEPLFTLARISKRYLILTQTNHENTLTKLSLFLENIFKKNDNIYEYNFRINDFCLSLQKKSFRLRERVNVLFGSYVLLFFEKINSSSKDP